MTDVTRRDALVVAGVSAAAVSLAAAPALAQGAEAAPPAFAGLHQPKPLKFDPAKLTGLSEKLITYWETIDARYRAAIA